MTLSEGLIIVAIVDGPIAGLFYFIWKRYWQ